MQAPSSAAIGYNHTMLAANSVPQEGVDSAVRSLQAHGLIVLMVVACVIGLIVIIMLLRTWRRYNERLNRSPRVEREPLTDVWHAAAERLEEEEQDEGDDDQAEPDEDEPDDPDAPRPGDL